MENDFEFDNLFDSINLTGQWQPSSMPHITDSCLNSQILDDIVLSSDDLSLHSSSINSDDISNALMDSQMDLFNSFIPIVRQISDISLENDDITKLISSPIEPLSRQSTIEDHFETMNINHSQDRSSLSVQVGSSPVEQKEIDNSILTKRIVREQQRILKNASKPRKNSGYQQASSTVAPADILSSYGGCQPCPAAHLQNDFDYQQQLFQFDSIEMNKIQIKSHPRPKFRPRTQAESKTASHYIRSAVNDQHDYPTIFVQNSWASQSLKNIIEVTLVGKDRQPHAYTIDNKSSKASFDNDALIFRLNCPHTLYFCVTDEDFKNGYKSFTIEYIKSKQDDVITKELIKTRQLDQSMLRFTRFFQTEKDTFHRDDSSVEYSCLMSEAYGDIGVEHMGPTFGPMGGNEGVYTLMKGRFIKDDLTVFITEETLGWRQQLSFTKNGNLVYFSMPPFPYSQYDRAVTNISIYYKGEELFQSPFLYKGSFDQELAALNLNDSTPNIDGPSSSNTFNALDFFSATGVCPVPISPRKSSTVKSRKRLANK